METVLDTRSAARHVNLSARTLEKKRLTGDGPPFYKLGHSVRYSREDLDRWLAENRRRSTSDPGPRGA